MWDLQKVGRVDFEKDRKLKTLISLRQGSDSSWATCHQAYQDRVSAPVFRGWSTELGVPEKNIVVRSSKHSR